jgi:hypothetical protein
MTSPVETPEQPATAKTEPVVQVPLVDHVTGDWSKWRQVVEANRLTATVEQKHHYNVWDHISDVIAVLKRIKEDKWVWYKNARCKYIDVRIDMRDGGCLIKDGNGTRINPSDLAHQHGEQP